MLESVVSFYSVVSAAHVTVIKRCRTGNTINKQLNNLIQSAKNEKQTTLWRLAHKQTVLTERPPLVGKV
jgi:pheromone shutdown protein TraB